MEEDSIDTDKPKHEAPKHHEPQHHEAHQTHQVHNAPSTNTNQMPWMLVSILLAVLLIASLYMNYSLVRTVVTAGAAQPTAPAAAAPTAAAPTAAAPTPAAPAAVQDIKLAATDHIRGDKNAPVIIVEYSDFQCPFCGRAEPTIEQVLKDYGSKVALVYRHFPLSFHENARPAAIASECANEQGKFWEFHDLLYQNQAAETKDDFIKYATTLKLDVTKFTDCITTEKYGTMVDASEAQGQTYGVQGTPAFFINGKLLSGAQPYSAFKSMVDAALA